MSRPSAESLSIVQIVPGQRPKPPRGLTKFQAKTWKDVVATKPVDWFDAGSIPILVAYCKSVEIFTSVSAELDKFDMDALNNDLGDEDVINRLDKLTKIAARHANLVAQLGAKMRLTQQSRYTPDKAAVANKKSGSNRPWEKS